MKSISNLILLLVIFTVTSCANSDSKKASHDLKVGGLYISQNEDGSFGVTKILALDEFAVHIRMYSDKFDTKPQDLNSKDLKFMMGHIPMAIEGFLKDKPELLKVEKVSEEELEGYNYYKDAMQ